MASYHCSIKMLSRSASRSSVQFSAYISADKMQDERLDKTFSYTTKEEVSHTEMILSDRVPEEWKNPEKFWNEVEAQEKQCNSQVARTWEIALPHELTIEQNKELAKEFAQSLIADGMPAVQYAIHEKKGNLHVHIMAPTRDFKNGKWQPKRKTGYVLDKEGKKIPLLDEQGNQKFRERKGKGRELLWQRGEINANNWNDRSFVKRWRERVATLQNEALEKYGHEVRVDHRSYQDQRIDKIPQIHEGYAARRMEQDGQLSERCQYNREIDEENARLDNIDRQIQELEQLREKRQEEITDVLARATIATQEYARDEMAKAIKPHEFEDGIEKDNLFSNEIEPEPLITPEQTSEQDSVEKKEEITKLERNISNAKFILNEIERGERIDAERNKWSAEQHRWRYDKQNNLGLLNGFDERASAKKLFRESIKGSITKSDEISLFRLSSINMDSKSRADKVTPVLLPSTRDNVLQQRRESQDNSTGRMHRENFCYQSEQGSINTVVPTAPDPAANVRPEPVQQTQPPPVPIQTVTTPVKKERTRTRYTFRKNNQVEKTVESINSQKSSSPMLQNAQNSIEGTTPTVSALVVKDKPEPVKQIQPPSATPVKKERTRSRLVKPTTTVGDWIRKSTTNLKNIRGNMVSKLASAKGDLKTWLNDGITCCNTNLSLLDKAPASLKTKGIGGYGASMPSSSNYNQSAEGSLSDLIKWVSDATSCDLGKDLGIVGLSGMKIESDIERKLKKSIERDPDLDSEEMEL